MAVIAKMNVNLDKEFPVGIHELSLTCVCENGLMAHYSPENEDAVFTKYSPSGNCKVQIGEGVALPTKAETPHGTAHGQVYVLFHELENAPSFEGCLFAVLARCGHVDDWGTSKKVFLGTAAKLWMDDRYIELPEILIPGNKLVKSFEYDITIDNPAASIQYKPLGLYWVTFYDAASLSMDEVLRLARS
jgi:hypothetical protein